MFEKATNASKMENVVLNIAERNQVYEGRGGTINDGKEYEWSLLAYCGILLLNSDIAEAWIATEPDVCGDFDDLIVYCKWKACNHNKEEMFLVQCKHSATKKTINNRQFLNSNEGKNFFLEKYIDTYNGKLHPCLLDNCDSLVSDTIRRQWNQIKCVLFTNNNIDAKDIFEETTDSSSLSLNIGGNVHKCKTGSLNSLIVKKTLDEVVENDKLWNAISEITLNKVFLIENINKKIATVKVNQLISKDKLNNTIISKVQSKYVPLQTYSKEDLKAAMLNELNKIISRTSIKAIILEEALDQIISSEKLGTSISKKKLLQILNERKLATILSKETVQELITPCFELNFEFIYQKLFIFSNQVNNEDVSGIIIEKLSKMSTLEGLFDFDLYTVVSRYMSFIKDWARRKLGGSYALTKTHIVKKISELMLEPYSSLPPLYKNVDSAAIQHIEKWHQIIQDKGVILVDLESDEVKFVAQFLQYYLDSKVCQYNLSQFLQDNWMERIENTEKDRLLIEEMLRTISKDEKPALFHVSKVLWKCEGIPLALEVKSPDDYKNVLAILGLSEYKLKAVIINSNGKKLSDTNKTPRDFQHLSDITGSAKQLALEGSVNLQGRRMRLNTLITKYECLSRLVTTKDIMYTFTGNFNVGNTPKNLPKYFVERSVNPVILDIQLIATALAQSSDLYVIKGINKSHFCEYIEKLQLQIDQAFISDLFQANQQGEALTRCKIVTNECQFTTDEIVKTTTEAKNIHYLLFRSDIGALQWVRTIGSTTTIRPFRLETKPDYMMAHFNITKQLLYLINQITVISANPGMGKSIMMDYIARTTSTDYWILQVNLNEYTTYYADRKFKEAHANPADHLFYFNNQILTKQKRNSRLNREAFTQFLNSKSLLVILDGFDEISPNYKDEVTAMTKALLGNGYRLVVTTRPVLQRYLEREFDVIAVTLNPFTVDDQICFLTDYFKTALDVPEYGERALQNFVKKLLVLAQKNLNDWEQEFTGVPLQTELLANVFQDDCEKYLKDESYTLREHFDLLYLYKTFTEKKIEILTNKFQGHVDYKSFDEYQKMYALKVLFLGTELNGIEIDEKIGHSFLREHLLKNGIMVSEDEVNLTFIHRTFAEYFAARWLSENMEKVEAKRLIKLTFKADYVVTRNIFDRLLATTDLHKAIINRHVDVARDLIRDCPEELNIPDAGGRFPIHLMAGWGVRHPLSKQKDTTGRIDSRINQIETTNEAMEQLLMQVCCYTEELPLDKVLQLTPLDYAVASESMGCLNAIICKVNFQEKISLGNGNIKVYIYYSSRYGYTSLIKRILQKCDLKRATQYFNSPLDKTFSRTAFQWASFEGSKDTVELFLSDTVKGDESERKRFIVSMISKADLRGRTALNLAVENDHSEIVALLVAQGASPEAIDNNGYSCVHVAARNGKNDSLEVLNRNKANINLPDSNRNTPLHMAAQGGHKETVRLLLQWKADAELKNSDKQTALHMASIRGHMEAMNILLNDNGKILDTRDKDGNTALHLSAKHGHAAAVELLILKKSDLSITNTDGNTALHLAAEGGHAKIVKMLLSDTNINIPNGNGNTPLHLALLNNQTVTASELLQNRASINQSNNQGRTALHEAVTTNCEVINALLLEPEVDIIARDKDGRTILHLAAISGNVKLATLFVQRGLNVDNKDNCGCTALHLAAAEGLVHMVTFLLSMKADVNAEDENKSTPLHFAVTNGRGEIVNMLLSSAAVNIDCANKQGKTALDIASENGQTGIINSLLQNQANTELFDSVEDEIFI